MSDETVVNPSKRRFGGISRLYGTDALNKFQNAHICVVGVGGVGSWLVEALARTGVGAMTLIDMDHVAESNINRQLPALGSTLGASKIQVLKERCMDINPACGVDLIDEFVDLENLPKLITDDFDLVADCIDSFRVKAALIAHCRKRKQPIITIGGAGGQIDPTRITVSDLYKTEQDALLAKTRRTLRRDYGFSSNPKRRFDVPCVWSDEPLRQNESCDTQQDSSLNCAGFGSCMPVTATFAMAAAAKILKILEK